MRIVEVTVAVAGLGDTLGEMRDWLDRNKCGPVKFETATNAPGAVLVRLEFSEREPAEAFEQHFGSIGLAHAA